MPKHASSRIEKLEPMRVARIVVKSQEPEIKAYRELIDWGRNNDPDFPENTRFFGFNDPCPKPGQTIYKYEAWMTVSDDTRGRDNINIKQHQGGRYAVTDTPLRDVGKAWDDLAEWAKVSGYGFGVGPALEEALTNPVTTPFGKAILRLYLPIRVEEE
jgi:DNA gyrase inhibitor GyrI